MFKSTENIWIAQEFKMCDEGSLL
uniref:Uncharacterized protein n=1 Tax=Anguilla anguilla TaxID=7936 RepID=A0A0E9S466_ANGAN